MPRSLPLGALALALLVLAPETGAQAPLPLEAPDFPARIDSVFAPWRGTDRPGCAVGLSHRGRVVLERGYGMADLQSGVPMSPATLVHSASVSKPVTALSVLLLEREGRLSLDDDVRRWLPELPRYGQRITLRHLLTHTSGLRDFFELLILARGRLEHERFTDADAMAMIRRQRRLNFAPGTQYTYSNTGYLLLAHVVERASGQRFADFTAARVFAPLGMRHTRFKDVPWSSLRPDPGQADTPVRASGYEREGAGWRTSTPDFGVVGSTNMETTIGDLLRLAADLDRPVVGDSALVARMLVPAVLANGDTTTYGFGLSLARDRGLRVAEHEGRDPGFRAFLGWYPEQRLAVALLCNAAALNPVGLGHDVAGIALGLPPQAPPPAPPPSPTADEDARRALAWAGVYLEPSTRQVAELTVRDGVLYTNRVGGARVEAIDGRRARLVGQPLELDFDERKPAGYRVRWLVPGRRADAFVWKAPTAPALDRARLASLYAGSYASEELGTTYRVEARDSTLVLHAPSGPGLEARPVFSDAFVSGQYTIQFVRSGERATGFEISHPRARGVSFARVVER